VLEAESNPSTVQYLNLLSRKKKCRFFTPFGVEALIGAYSANNRNGRKPFLNKPFYIRLLRQQQHNSKGTPTA
jgi:hypothetical protein